MCVITVYDVNLFRQKYQITLFLVWFGSERVDSTSNEFSSADKLAPETNLKHENSTKSQSFKILRSCLNISRKAPSHSSPLIQNLKNTTSTIVFFACSKTSSQIHIFRKPHIWDTLVYNSRSCVLTPRRSWSFNHLTECPSLCKFVSVLFCTKTLCVFFERGRWCGRRGVARVRCFGPRMLEDAGRGEGFFCLQRRNFMTQGVDFTKPPLFILF